MANRTFVKRLLLLIIISLPIYSCKDSNSEDAILPSFEKNTTITRTTGKVLPNDVSNAFKNAVNIQSNTSAKGATITPTIMEGYMLNYLVERYGADVKTNYSYQKNTQALQALAGNFSGARTEGTTSVADNIAKAYSLANVTPLVRMKADDLINKIKTTIKQYEIELGSKPFNRTVAANRVKAVTKTFQGEVSRDTSLSIRDKALLTSITGGIIDNIDIVISHAQVLINQNNSGARTIFGNILRAVVNTVAAVVVSTLVGGFAEYSGAPGNTPGYGLLTGPEGGFIFGVGWSVYMIVTGKYWINW